MSRLLYALSLALSLVLAGCGGGDEEEALDQPVMSIQPVNCQAAPPPCV